MQRQQMQSGIDNTNAIHAIAILPSALKSGIDARGP
jgi:hypothetical protein